MASKIDRVPRLRRRDVLAASAGLALLPAVTWARSERHGGLAVGFCRAAPDGAEDASVPVVAAGRLAAGETRLAHRSVRLTVHGLLGDTRRLPALGLRSAELRVGFPAAGVEAAEAEYRAWSYQLLPFEQRSSPISLAVPVDRGLALALETESFGSERLEAVLSTGREPGVPKLRAGRYLIAPGATEFRPRRFDPARSEPMIAVSVEPLA